MKKNFNRGDIGKILKAEYKEGFVKQIEGFIRDVKDGVATIQTGVDTEKVRMSELKKVKIAKVRY